MKLGYSTSSKDPVYYVQIGLRIGKKTTTRNILRIGKHSELLKITDDPLAYARDFVAKYNEGVKEEKEVEMDIRIDFTETLRPNGLLASKATDKNIGYLYLQELYKQLAITKFFWGIAKDRSFKFDPDLVNRFLTYSRILSPDSKLGSWEKLDYFFEEPAFGYQHIFRTLDLMCEHYTEYIEFLFRNSNKVIKRNTAVCYYDCTNYYFEAETQDPDYVDEVTGESFRGLRRYGFSKDHKPNPIVEMGLFMDTNGIPISMCIAPGNTNEQKTVIPLETEIIQMFGEKKRKFIYCADAGLGSYHIRNFNSMGGRAFIIAQSIKKLSKKIQDVVFNDSGYKFLSNDSSASLRTMQNFDKNDIENFRLYNDRIYKVIKIDTPYDVGLYDEGQFLNGKTRRVKVKGVLKQWVIVTFSRKSMEYQRYIRNEQIERAKKILAKMSPSDYKKGPNDVTRFIKKVDSSKDKYTLDWNRIAEEERYDGFYAIATNLEDEAKDIIAINEKRYKIEDCFRILKTDFRSRPVYHYKREHIIAHFMICYTALLIYRLLEVKLNQLDKNIHLTTKNITETLQKMKIANISDVVYSSQYTGSTTLTMLEQLFNLGLDKKYYSIGKLKKKCSKKTKFT